MFDVPAGAGAMGIYLNPGVTGGYIKNCTFNMATGSYAAIGLDSLAGDFTITGCTFNGQGTTACDVEAFNCGDYIKADSSIVVK